MRIVRLLVAAAIAGLPAVAIAAEGVPLDKGETVIAANVKTGARFSVTAGAGALSEKVFYVDAAGTRVPLLRLEPEAAGVCAPDWAMECHQAFGQPQRICFCATTLDGVRMVNTASGLIEW